MSLFDLSPLEARRVARRYQLTVMCKHKPSIVELVAAESTDMPANLRAAEEIAGMSRSLAEGMRVPGVELHELLVRTTEIADAAGALAEELRAEAGAAGSPK
jgi:hypothetical protein